MDDTESGDSALVDEVSSLRRKRTGEGGELPRRAWSPREVGVQLGIPYETVLAMIHSGQLGAVPCRKHYRVPESELSRLLDSATPEAA